jgi:hypothetical protein
MMITRRKLFLGVLGTATGITTVAVSQTREAEASNKQTRWIVPAGVNEINVKSWRRDGSRVMNYNFDVEPGQTFLLTAK